MKYIFPLIFFIIILSSPLFALSFEERNEVQGGIDFIIGAPFADVSKQYSIPLGTGIYARGLYQMNINDRYFLFPEIRMGWYHISHESESGRYLNFFPLYLNAVCDMPILHFKFESILLKLNPYMGYGLYYVRYKSSRRNEFGFDSGYQLGMHSEMDVKQISNVTFDLSLEYFLVMEKDVMYTGFMFYLGVSHIFKFKKIKIIEPSSSLKKVE
jgi:hypothetical protein